MSSTNHTTNYNLPQFVGTDKPAWLGDINPAMSAIDTQMKANADAATAAAGAAATADGKAVIAQNGVAGLQSALSLNDYSTIDATTFITTGGVTPSGSYTIAQNAGGSLFKFYGQVNIANGSDTDVTISCSPIPGLSGYYGIYVGDLNTAPDTAYQVANCGFQIDRGSGGVFQNLYGMGFAISSAGGVYFYPNQSGTITIPAHTRKEYKLVPCLYFNTNFGDEN